VYSDALVRLTLQGRLRAALLALEDGAFLSHRTALALHGLRPLNVRAIEVTVPADHTPRHRGLIVHRTRVEPDPDEIRRKGELRCSASALAVLQVAGRESAAELDRLIAEMARRRLLDVEQIERAIERREGARGVHRLRAALERYRPPSDLVGDASMFERDFAAWLAGLPEVPPPQRNVRLEDRWELDFFWPEQRLVVETDGPQYHLTPAELERDRVKDAWLQCRAIRVLRVTGFRFEHDRAGIETDLVAMLHDG
jgi:hypothetical protein